MRRGARRRTAWTILAVLARGAGAAPELASVLFSRVFAVGEHDRLLEQARRGLVDASFLLEPPVPAA